MYKYLETHQLSINKTYRFFFNEKTELRIFNMLGVKLINLED